MGVEKKEFTVNQMRPYLFALPPSALSVASKSTGFEGTLRDLAVVPAAGKGFKSHPLLLAHCAAAELFSIQQNHPLL